MERPYIFRILTYINDKIKIMPKSTIPQHPISILSKPKFKIGQLVKFPTSGTRTKRSRDEGIILSIERAYELQDNYTTDYTMFMGNQLEVSKKIMKHA